MGNPIQQLHCARLTHPCHKQSSALRLRALSAAKGPVYAGTILDPTNTIIAGLYIYIYIPMGVTGSLRGLKPA